MTKFDYLGTLDEWLTKDYSYYVLRILEADYTDKNIPINITTIEQIGIRILCTKSLSESIRNKERSIEQLKNNFVLKVKKDDGTSFFRLSEVVKSVTFHADGSITHHND